MNDNYATDDQRQRRNQVQSRGEDNMKHRPNHRWETSNSKFRITDWKSDGGQLYVDIYTYSTFKDIKTKKIFSKQSENQSFKKADFKKLLKEMIKHDQQNSTKGKET